MSNTKTIKMEHSKYKIHIIDEAKGIYKITRNGLPVDNNIDNNFVRDLVYHILDLEERK